MPMLRADAHADAVEHKGLFEEGGDASRESRGVRRVGVDEHGSQLIAADPDQHVGGAQRPDQPWAELAQQVVPSRMAE